MKLHNRPLYHCLSCGHIIAEEPGRLAPFCCGHEMVTEGEETLRDDFARELNIEPVPGETGLAPRWTAQESEPASVSL